MLLSSDKWQAARDRQWAIHEVSAYVLLSQIGWPTALALQMPHLTWTPSLHKLAGAMCSVALHVPFFSAPS